MRIQKLQTVDAFVAVDLDGAPGRGIVRLAPRVLQGGAKDLARSITYTLASIGLQETGISAGISAAPEERETALTSFVAELAQWETEFQLSAGKGVANEDLGLTPDPDHDRLLAVGVVAAGLVAIPGATTAIIEGPGGGSALAEELVLQGIEIVVSENPLTAEADLLFCGSTMGLIDHEVADRLAVAAVVPTGPLPITTRAVAHCRRREITALPDFVTTAGPFLGDVDTTREVVTGIIGDVIDHDEGAVLGASKRAEVFLATWQDELPFGRPMAP
ncbi:MAG: hypothetical protein VX833_09540 [Actinomycetota bacterium]|nr:hypothetical protein [Actinomycetota bacterium]